MSMAVAYECPTTSAGATMEDAGLGDSSAALVLEVAEGDHLAGRHHRPVTSLAGGSMHSPLGEFDE